MPDMGGMGGMM